MESQLYRIIFEGNVAEAVTPETALGNLQRLLKVDAAAVGKLFSGKRVVLEGAVDRMALLDFRVPGLAHRAG